MQRVVSSLALLAFFTGFAALGCSSDDRYDHGGDYGYGGGVDRCTGITTCGDCTPVLGCGWCSYPDGTGTCASSAASCTGDTFRWNWEPTGCPSSAVDSGTTTGAPVDSSPKSDAATDAPSDAPASDAPSEVATDAGSESSTDAPAPVCNLPTSGLNGCVPTTGGTLCGATQYTVACHPSGGSTPSPDASLKCAVELADPSGSYYCCPCTVGG